MINSKNESCGHFVSRFIPGKFRPTPLHIGQRYEWTLKYDPDANNGDRAAEERLKVINLAYAAVRGRLAAAPPMAAAG